MCEYYTLASPKNDPALPQNRLRAFRTKVLGFKLKGSIGLRAKKQQRQGAEQNREPSQVLDAMPGPLQNSASPGDRSPCGRSEEVSRMLTEQRSSEQSSVEGFGIVYCIWITTVSREASIDPLSSGRYWEEWSRAVSQVIKTHEWTGEMSKASFDEVRTVPQYATCSPATCCRYNPSREDALRCHLALHRIS